MKAKTITQHKDLLIKAYVQLVLAEHVPEADKHIYLKEYAEIIERITKPTIEKTFHTVGISTRRCGPREDWPESNAMIIEGFTLEDENVNVLIAEAFYKEN